MQKHPKSALPCLLAIDSAAAAPLHRQLYEQMRSAIASRRFAAGMRLPASRLLARDLGISRNTVNSAFAQLAAEGYLESRIGSGTWVTDTLPDEVLWTRKRNASRASVPRQLGRLSSRGERLGAISPFFPAVRPAPFRHGLPALDAFPLRLWARIAARRWRGLSRELLGYGHAAGYRPLREAVAAYLRQARGVQCEPEQVLMVAGSQQALYLVAQMLLDPGDSAWIEDPGYLGARAALMAAQARIVPVPVDRQGLVVREGRARHPHARLAYITPSNQYPTTAMMSLARRMELLEWSRTSQAWIVEDDYDSEFRFNARPVASLQGMDADGRVIYLGTFSKLLAPGLRLGYLVLPPRLVDRFAAASALMTRHLPSLEQVVLAEFIAEGHLSRHVRRMRMIYLERRDRLVTALERELADWIELHPPDAGTHAVAWLRRGIRDRAAARAAALHGVESRPFSAYCLAVKPRDGLVLGYGGFRNAEIQAGAAKLAAALRSLAS